MNKLISLLSILIFLTNLPVAWSDNGIYGSGTYFSPNYLRFSGKKEKRGWVISRPHNKPRVPSVPLDKEEKKASSPSLCSGIIKERRAIKIRPKDNCTDTVDIGPDVSHSPVLSRFQLQSSNGSSTPLYDLTQTFLEGDLNGVSSGGDISSAKSATQTSSTEDECNYDEDGLHPFIGSKSSISKYPFSYDEMRSGSLL